MTQDGAPGAGAGGARVVMALCRRFGAMGTGYVNHPPVPCNWAAQTTSHCAYSWAYHE